MSSIILWRNWFLQGVLFFRWAWFILLAIVCSVVSTLILPDTISPSYYQATLQVLSPLGLGQSTAQNALITFYPAFFTSPTTLSNVLTKHKGWTLADLQANISATPVEGTNIIQISAIAPTPQEATTLVNEVYSAALSGIHQHRSLLVKDLTAILNADLKQSQNDAASSFDLLQTLTSENLTFTFEYTQISSLYREQQQRISTINKQLLQLQQQGDEQEGILKLASANTDITTIVSDPPTSEQRLVLSPLVGLIMGIGAMLLVNTYSRKRSLRTAKRDCLLPDVIASIPDEAMLADNILGILKQKSPCFSLLRHLQYQASEHERQLRLITITSIHKREGKSVVAAGLALAAAKAGLRTLLIDANFHEPVLHVWFQANRTNGLLDAMQHFSTHGNLQNFAQTTPEPLLRLMPIDNDAFNEYALAELFQNNQLHLFTQFIRQQADLVILDGPILLSDESTTSLAQLSDLALLVVDLQKSLYPAISEARYVLSTIGVSSNIVLNRTQVEIK